MRALLFLICLTLVQPLFALGFATNSGNNTVSVIDTNTGQIISNIPVGNNPTAIVINASESTVYVTNTNSDTVSVIDTATLEVAATIPVINAPNSLAIGSAVSNYVVVGSSSNQNIDVIDTSSNSVVASFDIGFVSANQTIAVTPEGSYLYACNATGNLVSVTNMSNFYSPQVGIVDINVGLNPSNIAMTSDGNFALVANQDSASVSIIQTGTNTVAETVQLEAGSQPTSISISNDDLTAYVVGTGNSTLSLISMTFETSTAIGKSVSAMALSPDGNTLYVANQQSNTVSVIDAKTFINLATVDVGINPNNFAISSDSNKVYVANVGEDNQVRTVSLIEADNNYNVIPITIVTEAPSGIRPIVDPTGSGGVGVFDVVLTPDDLYLYGSLPLYNWLFVVDTSDYSVTTIDLNEFDYLNPTNMLMAPDGSYVYTLHRNILTGILGAGTSNGYVSILDTDDNTAQTSIYVGSAPTNFVLSADGSKIYTAIGGSFAYFSGDANAGSVSVLDITELKLVETIASGNNPISLALNPSNTALYVAVAEPELSASYEGGISNALQVITTDDYDSTIIGLYEFNPVYVGFLPNGSKAYLANESSNTVSVIDTSTLGILTNVDVGSEPNQLAISDSVVYVGNSNSETVSFISATTDRTMPILTSATVTETQNIPSCSVLVSAGDADSLLLLCPSSNTVNSGSKQAPTSNTIYGFNSPSSIINASIARNISDGSISLKQVEGVWCTETFVSLSWSAYPNASYKLYRNGVLVYAGTETSYQDHDLVPGVDYQYTLTIKASSGATQTYTFDQV